MEFSWSKYLVLRAGYMYEESIFDNAEKLTASTGFAAGASIEVPFKKDSDGGFSIDYAYQASNPFSGSHSIGVRVHL
jgi:hypothetical protein